MCKVRNCVFVRSLEEPCKLYREHLGVGLLNPSALNHFADGVRCLHLTPCCYARVRLTGLCQIVGLLKIRKKLCGNVERLSESLCHLRTNSTLSIQNGVNRLFRTTENESQIALAPIPLFHFLFDVTARMFNPTCACCRHVLHLANHDSIPSEWSFCSACIRC